jgi:hypothetical protein
MPQCRMCAQMPLTLQLEVPFAQVLTQEAMLTAPPSQGDSASSNPVALPAADLDVKFVDEPPIAWRVLAGAGGWLCRITGA